jgi:hypothetical protein
MGEALITRRGGGSDGGAALCAKMVDQDVQCNTSATKSIKWEAGITNNFVAYVQYGEHIVFDGLDQVATFKSGSVTINIWFTLSGDTVVMHITSSASVTKACTVYFGFY